MTFYQDLKQIKKKLALKTEELLRYNPTAWQTGDIITAVRLNKMEDGIESADQIPLNTVSGSTATAALDPNEYYVFGEVTSLTITLNAGTAGEVNEYHFRFTSGNTPTTLDLPLSVELPDTFSVEADTVYEISIIDNYGVFVTWAVS